MSASRAQRRAETSRALSRTRAASTPFAAPADGHPRTKAITSDRLSKPASRPPWPAQRPSSTELSGRAASDSHSRASPSRNRAMPPTIRIDSGPNLGPNSGPNSGPAGQRHFFTQDSGPNSGRNSGPNSGPPLVRARVRLGPPLRRTRLGGASGSGDHVERGSSRPLHGPGRRRQQRL